jgi:hypothetical protein
LIVVTACLADIPAELMASDLPIGRALRRIAAETTVDPAAAVAPFNAAF